jgi:hypothetical protein
MNDAHETHERHEMTMVDRKTARKIFPQTVGIFQPSEQCRSPLIFVSVRVFRGQSVCIDPTQFVGKSVCSVFHIATTALELGGDGGNLQRR